MFGVKMCVHQDQPQLYNLLCFIQQSLRGPSRGRTDALGADPFSQIQAGGGESEVAPPRKCKKNQKLRSGTIPKLDGFPPELHTGRNSQSEWGEKPL